jgi:hypothetical protein
LPYLAVRRVPTSKNSIGGSGKLQIEDQRRGRGSPTSLNSREILELQGCSFRCLDWLAPSWVPASGAPWTPCSADLFPGSAGRFPLTRDRPLAFKCIGAIGAVVARFVHTEEVTGSNPVSPTDGKSVQPRRQNWEGRAFLFPLCFRTEVSVFALLSDPRERVSP